MQQTNKQTNKQAVHWTEEGVGSFYQDCDCCKPCWVIFTLIFDHDFPERKISWSWGGFFDREALTRMAVAAAVSYGRSSL